MKNFLFICSIFDILLQLTVLNAVSLTAKTEENSKIQSYEEFKWEDHIPHIAGNILGMSFSRMQRLKKLSQKVEDTPETPFDPKKAIIGMGIDQDVIKKESPTDDPEGKIDGNSKEKEENEGDPSEMKENSGTKAPMFETPCGDSDTPECKKNASKRKKAHKLKCPCNAIIPPPPTHYLFDVPEEVCEEIDNSYPNELLVCSDCAPPRNATQMLEDRLRKKAAKAHEGCLRGGGKPMKLINGEVWIILLNVFFIRLMNSKDYRPRNIKESLDFLNEDEECEAEIIKKEEEGGYGKFKSAKAKSKNKLFLATGKVNTKMDLDKATKITVLKRKNL